MAPPFVRKFLNKTELELRCPNCENYADAFHYYYVHPFRKFLNATELPTLSQLVGEEDNKGKRPIRLSTDSEGGYITMKYVGNIESTPKNTQPFPSEQMDATRRTALEISKHYTFDYSEQG